MYYGSDRIGSVSGGGDFEDYTYLQVTEVLLT